MPAAMSYVPPNDPSRFIIGNTLNKSNEERRLLTEQFERAEKYYDGDQPKPLAISEDGVDDNVIVNITKQSIDRTLSFLFPSPFRLVTDTAAENTPEEQYLNDTIDANMGMVFWDGVAYNGALAGHNFVRVLPIDPENEKNPNYPRLVNYKPGSVIAYWKADDKDKVLWYEVRWDALGDNYLQDVRRSDEGAKTWTIDTYVQRKGTNRFEPMGTEIWPYPLSPIVDWPHLVQSNKYYGKGEATLDQMNLNNSINRITSDMARILRFHAFPKTIGIGMNAEDIQETAVDGFWTTENPEAEIFNLEMRSDLASSMNLLTYLSEAHLSQARVVIMKGSVKDFQRVTNTGIRAVFLDMIAKNQHLRGSYGEAIQRVAQRVLALGGFKPIRPDVIWPDPLPTDDTEAVNTIAIERNMKIVSHETAAKKRGYDWDEEKTQMEQEAKLEIFAAPDVGGKSDGGSAPMKTDKNEVKR